MTDTSILSHYPDHTCNRDAGDASIRSQLATSLERLKVNSVEILYLHAPDHRIPLDDTLKAVDSLHREGKFKEFGLSNFSAWLVAEVVNRCKQNRWILPTVYQVACANVSLFIDKLKTRPSRPTMGPWTF